MIVVNIFILFIVECKYQSRVTQYVSYMYFIGGGIYPDSPGLKGVAAGMQRINEATNYSLKSSNTIEIDFEQIVVAVKGSGLMLLYRPRDISNQCAYSHDLRYDLSFGMGMSDTITLVFRSLKEIDYQCTVEIVAESETGYLLVVIRYPNPMGENCAVNNAFTVLKKKRCYRLCDVILDNLSSYSVFAVKGRLRFRFISNSSINADMNAHLYQVTATSARVRPPCGCNRRNETVCTVGDQDYCFTSGVVCDGIRNCGVNNWFDERKAQCGLPVEKLSYTPVIAVGAAILCTIMAAGHILLRCLPPQASSFFIFNANEDNRLCIDPVLKPKESPSPETDKIVRSSLIPVYVSSSSSENKEDRENTGSEADEQRPSTVGISKDDYFKADGCNNFTIEALSTQRKITMRSMAAKIQEKLRLMTGRTRNISANFP